MEINPKFLAPCGLYCGVCAVLYATRDNNKKFQERLLPVYKEYFQSVLDENESLSDERKKKLRKWLSVSTSLSPEDIENLSTEGILCKGCLGSDSEKMVPARQCRIARCAKKKGYIGCHECEMWPCKIIEKVPMPPVGKKVIMRAIPHWREVGTEQFVRDEEARYICPECGHMLFRGAKRCNRCKTPVGLD